MNAWRGTSPYGAIAVYVGGKSRGCAQPQLTASWIRPVSSSGWKLIPLHVGAQPPCQTGSSPEKTTTATAVSSARPTARTPPPRRPRSACAPAAPSTSTSRRTTAPTPPAAPSSPPPSPSTGR
ncbi:glycoside hydrolase domain-containing protein [Streptomyces sp. NRRL B-24484]|uniref:glycoside hydrolase domain-containing protein n=1 Tax=Streptomyces sp. NRRL B-24484 TaxID=1463833 RepID=UPI003B641004